MAGQSDVEAAKAKARQRQMELSHQAQLEGSVFGGGTGRPTPESFLVSDEELEIRNQLAFDTEAPGAVGAGKTLVDLFRNAEAMGLSLIKRLQLGPGAELVKGKIDDRLLKLSETAEENQRLFNILADRRPSAVTGNFFTQLGVAFSVPGTRAVRGVTPRGLNPVTPRRATAASEATAGGLTALSTNQDVENIEFTTLGGTAIGAGVFSLLTSFNRAGRAFVGGKEASIQRVDDLLEAEKTLNVTGLLTTGELRSVRGKGILPKIEGVYDNLPIPVIGLSGKREAQQLSFDNAVRQIQAAFPDVSEDVVRKGITKTLNGHRAEIDGLYKQIDQLISSGSVANIRFKPLHYQGTAQKFLDRELAKGAAANPKVIKELELAISQGPVSFRTATDITSDMAANVRKAERGATDPAATGIDAGRLKQLQAAFYRDMDTWAKQYPENSDVFKLWTKAKTRYKETILPFNKRPFAPLFDENGFDSWSLSKAILDPSKTGQLSKLDPDGQLAFLFVNNALENSTKGGVVNIKQFAAELSRARNDRALAPLLQNVDESSRQMLSALVKLVDAAPRAFQSGNNVLRTTASSVAAAGAVGVGALGAENEALGAFLGGMSIGAMRFAIATPAGRAILTSAARVGKNNRQQLVELATRLNTSYLRFLETAAVRTGVQMDDERPQSIQDINFNFGTGLQ